MGADAETRCNELGSHLASIVSDIANNEASELCGNNNYCWIGAHDKYNESIWEWIDGTPFDYNQNTKRTRGDEDCMELVSSDGHWNDKKCTTKRFSICNPITTSSPNPTVIPTADPTNDPTQNPTVSPRKRPSAGEILERMVPTDHDSAVSGQSFTNEADDKKLSTEDSALVGVGSVLFCALLLICIPLMIIRRKGNKDKMSSDLAVDNMELTIKGNDEEEESENSLINEGGKTTKGTIDENVVPADSSAEENDYLFGDHVV